MSTNDGRVQQGKTLVEFPGFHRFQIAGNHGFLRYARFHPALPAHVDRVPEPVNDRYVAPRAAGAFTVEHRFKRPAVGHLRRETLATLAPLKTVFDLVPLLIAQTVEPSWLLHTTTFLPMPESSSQL